MQKVDKPVVEGKVVDVVHFHDDMYGLFVQPDTYSKDIGNLLRILDNSEESHPNRPVTMTGNSVLFRLNGYADPRSAIGKRCFIYSGGQFDLVAMEKPSGEIGDLVVWAEYTHL